MEVSSKVIDQLCVLQDRLRLVEAASVSLDDEDHVIALHIGISLARQAVGDLWALLDPSGEFIVPSSSRGWH